MSSSLSSVAGWRSNPADPMPQRGRTVLIVLAAVGAAIGFVGGFYYLIGEAGADVGSVAVALLYAVLPVPVLVGVYLWLDAYEPEPVRYVATTFAWGAFGAVGLVLVVQIPIDAAWDPSMKVSAVYLAPLLEETAKALILVLAFLRRRRVIDGVVDGFVYAGLAGLGFAFSENVLYYTSAYMAASEIDLPGTLGATGTFFGRGVMTPFLHPLFTTWTGVCLALAVLHRRHLVVRLGLPLLGLAVAMLAHGGWNAAATTQDGLVLLAAYGTGLAILAGLISWALVARRKEGRVLWDALTDMARRRHWLHVDEVPYLARLGLRQRARAYAKRTGGDETMRSVRAYQKLATRTAFLYDSVMRGRPKENAVAMVDLMRADMSELRPKIVLPPPVRIVKRLPRPVRPAPLGWHQPPPGWQQPPPPPDRLPQTPYGRPPGQYDGPPGG